MGKRGIFVVFEGIDGAGTTTQVALLWERIAEVWPNLGVVTTAEPSLGPIGMLIRNVLRGRVVGGGGGSSEFDQKALALLFAADRLDHLACEILPALENGKVVLCDRYVLSSFAYQTLHAPLDWVAEANRYAPMPDLTVYIDVPVDTALARIARSRSQREIFEKRAYLQRVVEAYAEALKVYGGPVVSVDGTLAKETVASAVFSAVEPLLRRLC